MLKPLITDPHAPWKQRFRVPTMESSQMARDNPSRGIVLLLDFAYRVLGKMDK